MKYLTFIAITLVSLAVVGSCSSQKSNSRDLQYEAYCDSIWEANPEYYLDVLSETDEYQEYVMTNGEWWDN